MSSSRMPTIGSDSGDEVRPIFQPAIRRRRQAMPDDHLLDAVGVGQVCLGRSRWGR